MVIEGKVFFHCIQNPSYISYRFMYYEKATLNGDNVLCVLYAAKKYMMQDLEKLCREFLEKELCPTNVCPVLDQVNSFMQKNPSI